MSQPLVGSIVTPPIALAQPSECYSIPASDSRTTTGTSVLACYLFGMINSLGSCSVNTGEIVEADLGDVFAANFRVVGRKPFGARMAELAIPAKYNTGNAGLVNINLNLVATTDPNCPQVIRTSRPNVDVVVTDSQNNIIPPAGGILPLSVPGDVDNIARTNVYPVSTTGTPPEAGRFEVTATVRTNFD